MNKGLIDCILSTLYAAVVVLLQPKLCLSGSQERQLLDMIFKERRYSKFERPVTNESEPIVVNFSLTLQQIIDVDEKNQIVHSNLWLNMKWRDPNLAWNRTQFPNVRSIRMPADQVWKPDILLYNSAHINIDGTYPTHVVVWEDGSCLWVPPGIFLSTCRINIKWFPFDDQLCELKFGSWTHDGGLLDLRLDTQEADQTTLVPNGEWIVVGFPGKRNTLTYDCCPEEYIDLTFTLHIRRRSLFYTFNLIVPCALISSMEFLAFTLPPESGEKISLGVTILLSLTVFSMMVSESMPQTSDAVPLIGTYFASIMLMCSLTVVFTVVVLNFHHRTSDSHSMPVWVRKGICEWLAWILRMNRPGRNVTFRSMMRSGKSQQSLDLSGRSSRSLLANVLDLDDDFRYIRPSSHIVHVNHRLVNGRDLRGRRGVSSYSLGSSSTQNGDAFRLSFNRGASVDTPNGGGANQSKPTTPYHWLAGAGVPPSIIRRGSIDAAASQQQQINSGGGGAKVGGASPATNRMRPTPYLIGSQAESKPTPKGVSEMSDIVKELRTITGKLKKDEATQDILNDWRFAALVIDRLCLYVFICITAVATCSVLLQAPHFV